MDSDKIEPQRTPVEPIEAQIKEEKQENEQPARSPRSSSSQSYSSSSSFSDQEAILKQQHPLKIEAQGEPQQDKKEANAGPDRRIRYKYCCKICKHTDKSKKACVCVVPLDQRRTSIGDHGCQTCGCNGCSKEDFISRGEDPEYRPGDKNKKQRKEKEKEKEGLEFEARNGCCRKCMKAFSKTNKSCLCQVPEEVRNTKLPSAGCKICGCFGCNPEDKKDPRNRKAAKRQKQRERSREKKKRHARSSSSSSSSEEEINPAYMNFYNVDKSVVGAMMVNEFRIDPSLLGFGIPQRSYSYILGKPK